ncbi:hypothetical protein LO80_09050 [Candidatus Francisella endociliophora]|uniref:GDSL family lipase n=1 Tax=Candidatus Francisella endociliophora TaxID=653937 RepID=A0A097ERA5_9GAMM|nr:SGNH/GDSL hydrolase family protein [Francisella sp. FSC1006]AIT10105.1 hypothetical protein LO80_09050 [Francisella sp. FSC1006]
MKNKKKLISLIILIFLAVVGVASYSSKRVDGIAGKKIANIVVFGDSLSDNGNTYKKSLEMLPDHETWYDGRFSNSKVWVEYLCQYSNDKSCKLIDNAYGGAYSKDGYQKFDINGKTVFKVVTNFLQQVENFTATNKKYNPATTLYVMDIGGNDIMDLKDDYKNIANNIKKAIDLLVKKDKAQHFIILNLPDFSKAPRYFKSSDFKRKKVHEKVVNINKQIFGVAYSFKKQGIDIKVINFYGLLNNLLDKKKYIKDKSCLEIPIKTDKLNFLISYDKRKSCKKNESKYIFHDNLHPTNMVHKKLAKLASMSF